MKAAWTRWLAVPALCLALGAPERAREAAACGGPDMGDFGFLLPVEAQLQALEVPGYDFDTRLELTFAYPLIRERPDEFSVLTQTLSEGDARIPTTAAIANALGRGDVEGARRAGVAVVDAFYALPPPLATPLVRSVFWPAIEVIELSAAPGIARAELSAFLDRRRPSERNRLAPRLRAALDARIALESGSALPNDEGNPRAASLQFSAFQRDFAARVPSGFLSEVRGEQPDPLFVELDRNVDDWLARHPTHPLADLAALWKVRIHHFSGIRDAAWGAAFSVWHRRPVRAAAEMLFLLRTDGLPSDTLIDTLTDPLLVAALSNKVAIDSLRFGKWWQLAMQEPRAPWSVCLQERLLLWVAKAGTLPAAFPEHEAAPSPLWGKLRALGLMRVRRDRDALRQLERLPPDLETARLRVKLHLSRGEAEQAVLVPQISESMLGYLIQAKLSEAALKRLSANPDPTIRSAVAGELASYAASRGEWAAAAQIAVSHSPERHEGLQIAAQLAKTPGADRDLALARFLDERAGSLLAFGDLGFYRGLSSFTEPQVASPESPRVTRAMLRSSERFRALELYTSWLARNVEHPDARAVLAEADRTYARLTYQGGSDSYFWGRYAPTTHVAAKLRRLGRRIRNPA